MYVPSFSFAGSRFNSITRLIEESGVVCGEMGGKRDWNMVVTRDSRCFGTLFSESDSEGGEVKLFITSWESQYIISLTDGDVPEEVSGIPFHRLWDASTPS